MISRSSKAIETAEERFERLEWKIEDAMTQISKAIFEKGMNWENYDRRLTSSYVPKRYASSASVQV